MQCFICSHEFPEKKLTKIWSPVWWTAIDGPILVCKNCKKFHEQRDVVFEGNDAEEFYDSCIQFITFRNPIFSFTRDTLLAANVLKGMICEAYTLNCQILIEYEGDKWLLTRYSIINFGNSNPFVEKLKL